MNIQRVFVKISLILSKPSHQDHYEKEVTDEKK